MLYILHRSWRKTCLVLAMCSSGKGKNNKKFCEKKMLHGYSKWFVIITIVWNQIVSRVGIRKDSNCVILNQPVTWNEGSLAKIAQNITILVQSEIVFLSLTEIYTFWCHSGRVGFFFMTGHMWRKTNILCCSFIKSYCPLWMDLSLHDSAAYLKEINCIILLSYFLNTSVLYCKCLNNL